MIWKRIRVSYKQYLPTTWIPVWWTICMEVILFLTVFSFDDWPINCFLFISSRVLFRSLFRAKVSRQSFTSPNQKLKITFHVKINSNFVDKKHRVRSVTFTSYFTSICLWFELKAFPVIVFPFQFLQHRHDFCLDQLVFNWIIHVIKCSTFTTVSPIKSKFPGPYKIQPVPIPFHKNWPISFYYCRFPILFSNTTTFVFEWI